MLGSSTKERVFGLDLMRALAIVLVLVGHCLWIFPQSNGIVASTIRFGSFLGVEIFFVLSGFLIGKILFELYTKEDFKIATVFYFLKRRWFRTLPSYFLVLLINILIAYYFLYLKSEDWKYFLFLQNFNSEMLPFFPESWSLSIEEYSYLLLPFALLFFGTIFKVKNKPLFFGVLISALIIFFIFLKIRYHFTTLNNDIIKWNVALKAVVIYRLDSIFWGVLCSWIALNYSFYWKKHKKILCLMGFLSLGFGLFGIGYFRLLIGNYSFFWNVFYLPFITVSISFFLPLLSDWKQTNEVFVKPILFISTISYSIYLLHYSIILQLLKKWIFIEPQNTIGLSLFTILYLVLTIFLSYFLYRFYEKPIMDLRDK